MIAVRTAWLGVLVLALAACGDGTATDPGTSNPDLAAARQRWADAGMVSYQYTLRTLCFCFPESPITITVKGGAVESAIYADTGAPTTPQRLATVPTMDRLFGVIEEAYSRNAAKVSVRYHPTLGYPEEIAIDYYAQGADDEIGYFVSGFQQGGP